MNILSIQSHVTYGYVGNKAATFPLQSMGFDVWPVNTVQFSNHTGYGHWEGAIFTPQHIRAVIQGLSSLGLAKQCHAILSGYIGDKSIGRVILETVQQFKKSNPHLIYLCDPVMGTPDGKGCFVKPDIPDFFRKESLAFATIITPNHQEAALLWEQEINNLQALQQACHFFHTKGVDTVIVTRLNFKENNHLNNLRPTDFLSIKNNGQWLASTPTLKLNAPINGSGDLLSALYLGYFLLQKTPVDAFKNAINMTYKIIADTQAAQQRELKILGNNYKHSAPDCVTLKEIKQ